MAHFLECRTTPGSYQVPQGRVYHVVRDDHAIVSDQVDGEAHRCVDIYRFNREGLICEMWTCVTHPVQAGRLFT